MGRLRSVAFIGVDGSGKTTQARLLRDWLSHDGATVVEAHSYGLKLLRFVPGTARRGDGSNDSSAAPAGTVARIAALAEMVDIALYAWAQCLRGRSKAFRSRQACWLVSDRSFDDVLAKHLRRGTLPPSALRTVRRLSPPIETTIWLRLEPEIALLRDGDFSAPYYEQADSAYEQLSEWMTLAVVSTGESESEEVARRVRLLLKIDEPRPIDSDAQGGKMSHERY